MLCDDATHVRHTSCRPSKACKSDNFPLGWAALNWLVLQLSLANFGIPFLANTHVDFDSNVRLFTLMCQTSQEMGGTKGRKDPWKLELGYLVEFQVSP